MSRARKTAAKSAAKNETRKETKATAKAASAPAKGMSLLAAAIEVLKASDEPLNCRQMVAAAKDRGLWTPGAGKTPGADPLLLDQAGDRRQGRCVPLRRLSVEGTFRLPGLVAE